MTRISYFQRFSQRENHATNNTLLVMRHFYQASPQKIGAVLSDLVDDDLSVGLVFEQQIKSSDSVPDALISQPPLDIFFETKRGGELDRDQIERHIASIGNSSSALSRKILIGLTRTPIGLDVRDELVRKAKSQNVIFVSITFADIVRALRSVCETHEITLRDILSDYEDYLISEDLMQIGDMMTVVPCGTSMNENVEYSLYFEPAGRPSKAKSKFFGLYSQKCIRYLASIKTIVNGIQGADGFQVTRTEKGKLSEAEKERIEGAIKACTYFPNFAQDEHRYHLFDEIHETEISKTSKGGIWGTRVFNLNEWLDYDEPTKAYSAKEAAEFLKGKTFE